MHDESSPDARVGQLFRRLSMMRVELGEPAFDRTIHDLLRALGVAALREAEHRARVLAERATYRSGDVRVTSYAQRRAAEPLSGVDDLPG